MSEVTISLDGHAEELAVFGSRDQYLRQIRDAVGVKVLARHGEVRIEGDADRIEQARRIFEGLRSIFRARKAISSNDVSELIDVTLQLVRARSAGQARDSRRQPRRPPSFPGAGAVHEGTFRERAGVLHRAGRHGKDLSRGCDGGFALAPRPHQEDRAGAAGGRGGRASRFLAGRSRGQDQSLLAPASWMRSTT